jgi:diguanylate cyclase (GGDEF)-like protein
MKVSEKLKREGLIKYMEALPFPAIAFNRDCEVLLLNSQAQERFREVNGQTRCYEVTHNLERPCWEVFSEEMCPLKKMKSGKEPFAYHDHGDEPHILVSGKIDDELYIEFYLDSYVTDLIREFKFLAEIDSLTGVYNRRKIEEILSRESERSKRYGNTVSLMLIDIDNFKDVNDTYGHQMGDEVLKRIARIIRQNLRRTDSVGRYGGEEFLVILPETEVQKAIKAGERIRKAVESERFRFGKVTVSVGVTVLKSTDDFGTLFNRLDRAMYLAKERGKNRVEYL